MKIAPEISTLSPYVPGLPINEVQRQFGLKEVHKLASNENPLGPSPKVVEAIQKAASEVHLYPDGSCFDLRNAVSKAFGIPGKEILFGSGSDEIIDLIVRTYGEPGDAIMASPYGFNAYKIRAQASRLKTIHPPMRTPFHMDLAKIKEEWNPSIKFIFIDNPNNPTGVYYSHTEIEKLMEFFGGRDDVFVILDEAYTHFVRHPDPVQSLKLRDKYKNLLVLRTFSKIYGLAGLRLGVLFAPEDVVGYLNRVRLPFNVNLIVQKAAIAAMDDQEHIQKTCQVTWEGLDFFYNEMKDNKIDYTLSQGNFVLFNTHRDVAPLHLKLLQKGIILRPVGAYGLPQHFRMSVGLPAENRKAMAAIIEVLK